MLAGDMAAEWRRAPLPDGHEAETRFSDGSNALHRIVLVAVAIGGVLAYAQYRRADRADDRADDRRAAGGASAGAVRGALHLPGPDVDLEVGAGGWRHRGEVVGGQLYVPWGDAIAATLEVRRHPRVPGDDGTADGLHASLAAVWRDADAAACAPAAVRGDAAAALHCNDDPRHVWAWAHGAALIVVDYAYDPAHQPDYGEVERMVGSIRPR